MPRDFEIYVSISGMDDVQGYDFLTSSSVHLLDLRRVVVEVGPREAPPFPTALP